MRSHLVRIASAFKTAQKPPVFVSGLWSVPKDLLKLFYMRPPGTGPEPNGQPEHTKMIQSPAKFDACKSLTESCHPATFGRNKEDVLDESYRKAGKMDRGEFSISFEGAMGVSLEQAAKQLLRPSSEAGVDEVSVELYKLNVYGTSTL